MVIRLAVVGHYSSISEIKEIINDKFKNIEVFGITLSGDADIDSAVRQLRETLPHCDGILYTRRDPYKMMIGRVDHGNIPVRYVDIDGSSFIHSLLVASHHYHRDICRVSVDTLNYVTIAQAYTSLGISEEQRNVHVINVDIEAEQFVQSVTSMHRQHYQSGQCGLCVTNIRSVFDCLQREDIPCVLMYPNSEAYIYEIRRLTISSQMKQTTGNKFAILSIAASTTKEQYTHHSSFILEIMDRNRVNEIIAYFAQRISGMYIPLGGNGYLILCEYQNLTEETNNLSRIELLGSVYLQTAYTLSIGIGIGTNLQQTHSLARMGEQRALRENGNRAYVVYSQNDMVGPIEPNEIHQNMDLLFDQRLSHIAETSGLSINTILKTDTLIKQKQNRSFIIQELADDLNVSVRTANRIVTKLEKKGFILEAGRMVTGEKGRPTRIFRAMW